MADDLSKPSFRSPLPFISFLRPRSCMRFLRCIQLQVVLSLFFCPCSFATAVNVTVDDSDSNAMGATLVYSPSDAWHTNECDTCITSSGRPDISQMYEGTWHASMFNSQGSIGNSFPNQTLFASLIFNGTALYVYAALANSLSDMTFLIDGIPAGTFNRPGNLGFQYNMLVFANESLSPQVHTLSIQNGHSGGEPSLLLLDRIVYTSSSNTTTGDSSSASGIPEGSSRSTLPIGAIAGIVVAVVAVTALIVSMGFLCYLRRRRPFKNQVSLIHQSSSTTYLKPENQVSPFDVNVYTEGPKRPGPTLPPLNVPMNYMAAYLSTLTTARPVSTVSGSEAPNDAVLSNSNSVLGSTNGTHEKRGWS
ncbi:hypothetical protein C8J56DRAFT_539779 [Mycena floridula]|nr:hypothetical protein C8J56DRAFT_539779 [Mycena floridula]